MFRIFLSLYIICVGFAAHAQDRVALVIGNSVYENVPRLDNPTNDASAVSRILSSHGFDVQMKLDLGAQDMRRALRSFRRAADAADYALVYYAGHGIEVSGQNYLVPVNAILEDARDANVELINLSTVLNQISGAKRMKMVVLDACRNNPFANRMKLLDSRRSVGRGLTTVSDAGANTLVAYAAAAGEVTPDGFPGENSPFTTAFLEALQGPPRDVRRLMGSVRERMSELVPGSVPFVYSSLGGEEYVINPDQGPAEGIAARPDESKMWSDYVSMDGRNDPDVILDYLEKYAAFSDNVLYRLAQRKLQELAQQPVVEPPDEPSAVALVGPEIGRSPAGPKSVEIPGADPIFQPPPRAERETSPKVVDQATPAMPSDPTMPPVAGSPVGLPDVMDRVASFGSVPLGAVPGLRDTSTNRDLTISPRPRARSSNRDPAPIAAVTPVVPSATVSVQAGTAITTAAGDTVDASVTPNSGELGEPDIQIARLDTGPVADTPPSKGADPVGEAEAAAVAEAAAPDMTVEEGKKKLQVMLADRNCYSGAIDGIVGRNTLRGLRSLTPSLRHVSARDLDSVEEIQDVISVLDDNPDKLCADQVKQKRPKTAKAAPTPARPRPSSTPQAAPSAKPKKSCLVFEGVQICN